MIVEFGSASGAPPPKPPPPPPLPKAPPSHVASPAKADSVSKKSEADDLVSGISDWVKTEWPTVASVAHGFMSTPGIVSQAYVHAAEANLALGSALKNASVHWAERAPAARQTAIDALAKEASGKSATVEAFAKELSEANSLPRALDAVSKPLDRILTTFGRSVSASVHDAIDGAPPAIAESLRGVTSRVESSVGGLYGSIKDSVQAKIATLPSDLAERAPKLSANLEAAAKADSSVANGFVRSTSRAIGTTFGDVGDRLPGVASDVLDRAPAFLRDTPIVGLALAGTGTALDVKDGKSVADATIANFGSTFAGTAAGSAATSAIAAGGITDVAGGELAAAVLATGPGGWAVAGGVVVGAAVGYGVYKAIESQAGQIIIDGAFSGNGAQIVKGLGEAGDDVASVGKGAAHLGEDAVHGISHGVSSLASHFGL